MRFKDAVPLGRDRRELWHRLRLVLRAVEEERERTLGHELQQLAGHRSAVVRVIPDAGKDELLLLFRDGTCLALRVRDTTFELEHSSNHGNAPVAWLCGAQPCLGHGWYRLHFVDHGARQLDVLARVTWPGNSA